MKSQNRRANQGTMKSPSPDIANRSIIVNTKSPANQIKEYIRMRQSSNSPKSLTTSFHQISKLNVGDNQENKRLKKYIQELEARMDYLERIRISHQNLTVFNQRLNNQLAELKQQLRQKKQSSVSGSPHNLSPKSIKMPSPKGKGVSLVQHAFRNINPQVPTVPVTVQNESILRQFNQRLSKMSDENKRLGIKLKDLKDQKDLLEMQNMRLKDQIYYSKSNLDLKGTNSMELHTLQNLKRYFNQQVQRICNYQERTNQNRLLQTNSRITRVQGSFKQMIQRQNKARTFNRTNSPHQLKANLSIDTNFRSQYQDPEHRSFGINCYQMAESKYTSSPSQVKAFTLDNSPIRALQEQKFKIKSENQRLLRKIAELQLKLKQTLFSYSQAQKRCRLLQSQKYSHGHQTSGQQAFKKPLSESSSTMSKFYQEKAQSLQLNLKNHTAQLKIKDMTISQQQKRLQEINKFVQSSIQNYETNIQQEKQKNAHYERQIQQFQQKMRQLTEQYNTDTQQKDQYENLQKQLAQLKNRYQDIREIYDSGKFNFDKYLQMVLEIRYSITGDGVEKCIREVQNKWQGYDELQLQIIKIHQSSQTLIYNLKRSNLQKDQKVAQLQRSNQILSKTIEQINIQRQKLQNAIFEFKQPIRGSISQEQLKKRMTHHQSGSKTKQPCQIREYINRTVSKIGDLERQIDSAIKTYQRPTSKNYPSQNISSYFRAAEGDTIYRSTIKPKVKQTDYEEDVEDPSLLREYQEISYAKR